jgi:cobalt/nickel transport system ATP-binding protein
LFVEIRMPMGAAISVTGLTFAYAAGPRALDDVSFRIEPGERVGVIGPNGAGKSTLFLCLAGVLPAETGAIQVAGLDPAIAEQRRRLPAHLGVLFAVSDDQLFHATVFDDVAFGPLNLGFSSDDVRARAAEAIACVGLTGAERRIPSQLSEGEKRRTALAGILAMRPQILLLDEPSIFLDPRGRRELLSVLEGWSGSWIVATHDLEFVRQTCGRVLVLDAGRLVAEGPTDVVLANAALMEQHGLEVPHSLRKGG